MDLNEVRSQQSIVQWWAAVYHHKNFQTVILKMLHDTHPLRFVDTAPVTTPSAEKRLGMIESYELALERLRLCAQFQQPPGEMPTATFEPPKEEEEA